MKKTLLASVLMLSVSLFTTLTYAKISLPEIISSNMVLQRNTKVALWGWADAGEKIIIRTSWMKPKVRITAASSGDWKILLQTTNSKMPQSIWISSNKQTIALGNILFGEVWLCSGQSNMEIPISGYLGQSVYGAQEAITDGANDNLRLFTVSNQASLTPQNKLGAYKDWQSASAASVKDFSAVAYFFGKHLQKMLGVPVGLIHSSWGGSLIEAWMSREALGSIKHFDLNNVDLKRGNRFPTVLFNAMVNPLIPYTIKGAIWYQGEGNISQPKLYKLLFPAMVSDWRARWGIGDFPFYYVQIAPFGYSKQNRLDDPNNAAFLREAQLQCQAIIPNSGMAVTLDIGTEDVIHPPNKEAVAKRLLYNALNKTYDYSAIDYSGPVFDSIYTKDDGIYITFKHAEKGLYAFDKLDGFEVAGADKVFYAGDASIYHHNEVFVKSNKVSSPVAVRYAWRDWTVGTLFDNFLLPASSFRSDNWDDAKQSE